MLLLLQLYFKVVTPAGIKELEGDIDDLKKQRYGMKFEYNRKRLERLVDGQNQESSNIDLYTLLRKVSVLAVSYTHLDVYKRQV